MTHLEGVRVSEDETTKLTDIADVIERAKARIFDKLTPAQIDQSLPKCPLCGAGAKHGSRYTSYLDISHTCSCIYTRETDYYVALRRVWSSIERVKDLMAMIPYGYKHMSIDTFDYPNLSVIQKFKKKPTSIYIYGTPGNGKTHLSIALGRYFASLSYRVGYWSEADLFHQLRLSIKRKSDSPELTSYDALILDDIGKIKSSEYTSSEIYRILEHYNSNNKIIIATSQHNIADTAKRLVDDPQNAAAVASRLSRGIVFNMIGEDRRILESIK